ncbi:uncharacterized protein EI90DRAFT_3126360 [Cantharellus anzutake]|uniref:uncharacterized protein n=1 Tax=Cantharellus anzutake TaxID=1750568 RepID=UPI0019057168|nr:uncharacterized protein EI90DRAFT_3126360 [Cantharellus anzutake]KAF8328185.1 hypothetical protein EI90DRAFT_3126360 [Cantharellus anzutake]
MSHNSNNGVSSEPPTSGQMLHTQTEIPIFPGQWGPVTVFNPAPTYVAGTIPLPMSQPPASTAEPSRSLKGKQTEKGTKDFEYEFMLNTMDPKKEDETVYFVDSKDQSPQEVLDEILTRMGVDLSVHRIGYHLSDEKQSIWTRINSAEDFAVAVKAQRDIQSRAFKQKKMCIINKDAVKKEPWPGHMVTKKCRTATDPSADFRHLHVTNEALAVWANAMVDGVKDVSFTQPPNNHLFRASHLKPQQNDGPSWKHARSLTPPSPSLMPMKHKKCVSDTKKGFWGRCKVQINL